MAQMYIIQNILSDVTETLKDESVVGLRKKSNDPFSLVRQGRPKSSLG